MKKILILTSIVVLGYGCDKVEVTAPIGADQGTPTVRFSIVTPPTTYPRVSYIPNGSAAEYLSLSDRDIKVKFEAPTVAPQDIYLTYSMNTAGITKVNAERSALPVAPNTAPYKPFIQLPDSCFQLLVTKDTIRKGEQYAEKVINNIVVYTTKIDPSINYMIPLSVTATGYPSAAGTGTIYYYIIGNPLAGKYNDVGTRYNYVGSAAYAYPGPIPTPVSTNNLTGVKSAIPIDGQTVTMSFSNLGFGSGYEYGYLVTGDLTFANITLSYNDAFLTGNGNIKKYLVSYSPPSAGKPKFHFITWYNNDPAGAGNDRIIDEDFVHQ